MRTASTRAVLLSLLAGICNSALACSTPVSPDAGGSVDAIADVPVVPADAQDAIAAESAVDVASDAFASDTPVVTDAASDAPQVMFNSTVVVDSLFENCMPIVAPDPLRFMGTLRVMNTGGASVGPITAAMEAVIVTDSLTEVARFSLDPVRIDAIAPGTTGMVALTKRADSLTPSGGACGTVHCGSIVRVRVAISGPGVPAGTYANSPLTTVTCP